MKTAHEKRVGELEEELKMSSNDASGQLDRLRQEITELHRDYKEQLAEAKDAYTEKCKEYDAIIEVRD